MQVPSDFLLSEDAFLLALPATMSGQFFSSYGIDTRAPLFQGR